MDALLEECILHKQNMLLSNISQILYELIPLIDKAFHYLCKLGGGIELGKIIQLIGVTGFI